MNLYIGTSGFSYKQWKGSFYPADMPADRMLHYYGEQFRTVEINSTFRRMPAATVLEGWAGEIPADFKFVLMAPQRITHTKRLKGVGEAVTKLFDIAGVLKKHLGPLLFQLPANFKKDVP